MTKSHLLLVLLFLGHEITYSQYFGGEKNDRGISFCQHNKLFFLTGTTRSFGAGSEDIWIVRVNENFKVDFHVEWGGPHHDHVSEIIATSDQNFIIAGHSWDAPGARTGIVLAKFDAYGDNMWISYFGGDQNDFAYSVKETADGGCLVTGINRDEGSIGAIFLIKTDVNGLLQWQKYYDTDNKDIGIDVIENDDSSMLILATTSSFTGKIANSSEYLSNEASKIMIIKTDNLGNELWRKFHGGVQHDFAKRIKLARNNCYYFVGSSMNNTNGSFDIVLYKIDEEGDVIWRKNYGGSGYDYGNDLDIDEDGNMLLTGTSNSFSLHGDPDAYVLKVDENGNEIWSEVFGGADSDYGNSGHFLSDGSIAILGSSKSGDGDDLDLLFMRLSELGEAMETLEGGAEAGMLKPLIFPNPTSTYLTLYLGESYDGELAEFSLYSTNGTLIFRKTFDGIFNTLNFGSELSKGIYLYNLKVNEDIFDGKIIVN